jgi:oligopeptidase B
MKRLTTRLLLTLLSALLAVSSAASSAVLGRTRADGHPPVAKKIPHTTEIHGDTLKDDYFWFREKKNPEVIQYLESENAYTEEMMKPTKDLQDALYKEMLGRIKQTDLSVPSRIGQYYYYQRTEEGKQYPYMCRKKGDMDGQEELLLDLNKLAEGHSFLGLGGFHVSDDGNLLAYSTDTTGYRQYNLHVKDLRTGQTLSENIERAGSIVWSSDNKTLFYTTEDAVSKRSDKFWRHVVSSDKNDLIYEEKDELFDVFVRRSDDKKVISLVTAAKTSTEYRYVMADNPTGEFKVIIARRPDHEYSVEHYNDQFYIVTNNDAKNFRVVTAPIDDPSEKNWQTFIPYNPEVKIDGLTFFANHLVVSEREGGLTYLRVIDMRTKQSHRITTDEPDYALFLGGNPEFNTSVVRFNYQSMVTPSSVYDYDMNTRERKRMKQQEVLGGYDPKSYEARRIWSVSRDGVKVPISLVYKKGVKFDGRAPMLLYAYGSYGVSMAPTFSSPRLSLLDRGVIYALAYIRGGGELGEDWRLQGRMMNKQTRFTTSLIPPSIWRKTITRPPIEW